MPPRSLNPTSPRLWGAGLAAHLTPVSFLIESTGGGAPARTLSAWRRELILARRVKSGVGFSRLSH